jgi:tetratricopeptide (TPR) repeat protein
MVLSYKKYKMYESLEDIYRKFNYSICNVNQYKYLEGSIIDLYEKKLDVNNFVDLTDSNKLFWTAKYYTDIEKDYDMMKKYYLMAIELGDSSAMNNLGYYYKAIEKDYRLMKKYYLMAIELGDSSAMFNLGLYYEKIKKDYEMMKKYYLMAIELDNSNAMNNLGLYYKEIEKDYEMMKKYYLMAIELDNLNAMNNLGSYYNNIDLYRILNSVFNKKNSLIEDKLKQLEKTKEIIIYKNKIRLFTKFNNFNTCIICKEDDVLNIDLECGHEICICCYKPNFKCYYNCC